MGRGCADSLESQEFPIIIPLPLQQRGGRKHWRDPRAVPVARLRAAAPFMAKGRTTRFRTRRRAQGAQLLHRPAAHYKPRPPKLSDPRLAAPSPQQIWGPAEPWSRHWGAPAAQSPRTHCRGFPSTFKAGVLSWCRGSHYKIMRVICCFSHHCHLR